jgi:hypothetical protein
VQVASSTGTALELVTVAAPLAPDVESPPGRLAAWSGRALLVAAGLELVVVFLLLGTLFEALAGPASQGALLPRIGAAFAGTAGTSHGLVLLIAAALCVWAGREAHGAADELVRRLLWVAFVLGVVVCVATPLAMWGDVAYIHHAREAVTMSTRWGLLTFLGLTAIPAALAALVGWWGLHADDLEDVEDGG